MFRRPILLLALLAPVAAVAGCPTTLPPYNYATEPDPRKLEYLIGPSDLLHVTVWRNPDLSGDAVVRPDGTISLPLVGDVPAAGRTPKQVKAEISHRLGAYLKGDEAAGVTVSVTTVNSYRFVVSGSVERAGAFTANHYVTVSEAIALAGGPNRYASADETVIIRSDAKGVRRIPVDYPSILSGKHPEHDLVLIPGDTIYVP